MIQISQYLGYGRSGLFCADLPSTSEPWSIHRRMENLTEASTGADLGIQLELDEADKMYWEFGERLSTPRFAFDRWPTFEKVHDLGITGPRPLSEEFDFTLQYFCRESVIFQQYVWEYKGPGDRTPKPPRLSFSADILIRDLDFMDGTNRFNDRSRRDPDAGYSCVRGPNRHGLTIVHPLREYDPTDCPCAVGLVTTAFVQGRSQRFRKRNERNDFFEVELSKEMKDDYCRSRRLEVTVAFKLRLMSSIERWESFLIPLTHLRELKKALSQEADLQPEQLVFSPHPHLDFAIRRNVYHILSVCSVRMDAKMLPKFNKEAVDDPNATAIALTCGDLSGHLITSPSSLSVPLKC